MFFCVHNKGNVQISEEDYKNGIVILRTQINKNQRRTVGLGTLISSEWVLITDECFEKLKPFQHITAAIGSELTEITIVGYQELLQERKFYILIVSNLTVYSTILTSLNLILFYIIL